MYKLFSEVDLGLLLLSQSAAIITKHSILDVAAALDPPLDFILRKFSREDDFKRQAVN